MPRNHVCFTVPHILRVWYITALGWRDKIRECLSSDLEFLDIPWTTPKGFYRSANAIFGKVGQIASQEVVLQLLNSKCIPVLLYGLEACPLLLKSDIIIIIIIHKILRYCSFSYEFI